MYRLVETIKIEDGRILNLSKHNERLCRSIRDLFKEKSSLCLENVIKVPLDAESGIYKCRVEYDFAIRKIEFIPYIPRKIKSIKLIEDNTIEYQYKYTDRRRIEDLFCQRGECDEIMIVKEGMVTDSSYSNFIFRNNNGIWVTPSTYLLAGTRRASLLLNGRIVEKKISIMDIGNYKEVRLINAMLDIDDSEAIPLSGIL